MTTLAELSSDLFPGAIVAGEVPSDRPVAWVRVMRPRVPAFDALDPGDLAIVPAAVVESLATMGGGGTQPEEAVATLAAALAAAPSAGVILVAGDAATPDTDGGDADRADGSAVLDGLAAALSAAGVPAVRLPRTDVVALERSVIGYLVARGAELERRAGLVEADLAARALDGAGAPELVAALAGALGRAVALEAADGSAVAVHAPAGVADAVAAVARYRARPRQGIALRLPLPAAGGAVGALALLGTRPAAELERVIAVRVAGLLALELARQEAVRRAGDEARRGEGLPSDGPPWVMLLARQRTPGVDDGPDGRTRRDAARRELRLLAPARRMALRGDADSLEIRIVLAARDGAAEPAGDDDAPALAARIASFLDRVVAVSRPFSSPQDRPAAEAETRATLDAATALADPPRVAMAARLPVYRLMGALHNLPDGERLASSLLQPLLGGRPDIRREHLETLRAVLDGGGVAGAASRLGVHRNTVGYRLRRIEELTGWDLGDPELRLALSVALVLVPSA